MQYIWRGDEEGRETSEPGTRPVMSEGCHPGSLTPPSCKLYSFRLFFHLGEKTDKKPD